MTDVSDLELLRNYQHGSEAAFAALVQRHVNLVYSTAYRHVGISAQAEEITQVVFLVLARKAGRLRAGTVLEGWLYETTRLTSLNFLRGERRRQFREQEAYMQSTAEKSASDPGWDQLAPLLDEAMARLGNKERDAVVLRYFQNKSLRDVAAALGINEGAAQKRVLRAVEKLRRLFAARGVVVPAAVLTTAMAANSVHGAPIGLAGAAATVATGSSAVTTATSALTEGVLKIMAWTKAKTVIAAGIAAVVAVGTATVTVKNLAPSSASAPDPDAWRTLELNEKILAAAPSQTRIVPTRVSGRSRTIRTGTAGASRRAGVNVPIHTILVAAYGVSPARIFWAAPAPQDSYDFICTSTARPGPPLQNELRKALGLRGRNEMRTVDVLVLKLKSPNAPGLKPNPARGNSHGVYSAGEWRMIDYSLSELARDLEPYFPVPIVDQTGLTQNFDITLKKVGRDQTPEKLKQALLDQLGLELTPGRERIELLIVEQVRN